MTELKSLYHSDSGAIIEPHDEASVFVQGYGRTGVHGAIVNREEFAQAVRDLGFVVFEEKEQYIDLSRGGKDIGVNGHYRTTNKEFYEYTAEQAEADGLRLLALSAHLKANPPIDQEQVEAFKDAIVAVDPARDLHTEEMATEFVKAGYKITKEV